MTCSQFSRTSSRVRTHRAAIPSSGARPGLGHGERAERCPLTRPGPTAADRPTTEPRSQPRPPRPAVQPPSVLAGTRRADERDQLPARTSSSTARLGLPPDQAVKSSAERCSPTRRGSRGLRPAADHPLEDAAAGPFHPYLLEGCVLRAVDSSASPASRPDTRPQLPPARSRRGRRDAARRAAPLPGVTLGEPSPEELLAAAARARRRTARRLTCGRPALCRIARGPVQASQVASAAAAPRYRLARPASSHSSNRRRRPRRTTPGAHRPRRA